jgi:response regulator RpfG family c-di-GMP phosphodiesterase
MENHAAASSIAVHLLKPVDAFRPAITIPYCHHEKWDGSGYPRGLKGGKYHWKPASLRLLMYGTRWLTTVSTRPAWSEEKALQYLYQQNGKQF